jgi:hypothetical protein
LSGLWTAEGPLVKRLKEVFRDNEVEALSEELKGRKVTDEEVKRLVEKPEIELEVQKW